VLIVGASDLTIANSIVSHNSGENCVADASNSVIIDGGHNLSSDSSCNFASNFGADNVNPLIGPLAGNGGLTRTHALLQGSPAIDAADDALCPPADQRGTARPQGAHCDVGAYEATGDEPEPEGTQTTWGNANCSGENHGDPADPVDSLLTLRADAGLGANTGDCPELNTEVDVLNASLHLWGDVDCSGALNPVDSLKILRFDAGLSVAQEEDCPIMGAAVTLVEA
jgi:hypothetical protein